MADEPISSDAGPPDRPHDRQLTTGVEAESLRRRLLDVTELLQTLGRDLELLDVLEFDERIDLVNAAGDLFQPDPVERRRQLKLRATRRRAAGRQREQEAMDDRGIRVLRAKPVFTTPHQGLPSAAADDDRSTDEIGDVALAVGERHCYVCKQHYTEVHHFYDQLCPACASFNFAKRDELADLRGTVALLTGGRVKIGYQAGIKLLRSGASLIVATRFPRDAAARYAAEPDAGEWSDRLEVFGLDLRHTPSVEAFCSHLLGTRDRLDVIVNNACQTVRRPPAFYRHMMELETAALGQLDRSVLDLVGEYEGVRGDQVLGLGAGSGGPRSTIDTTGLTRSAEWSQVPFLADDVTNDAGLFPHGRLDQDLQQVDRRDRNSWRLLLHEVSSVELLETQLVNAVAPFVINARLRPLMDRTPGRAKHVVNVSAMEGQFYRRFKTTRHPHTNMAKAALNMMTRTSATDFHGTGIHMNSVDTGWVSDEDPIDVAQQKRLEQNFHPPLDIVDGAARIVDPIIDGHNTGVHVWGKFLKDYRPTDW